MSPFIVIHLISPAMGIALFFVILYSGEMEAKRGAPTKPPEERKSVLVPIRMTADEKAELESAADGKLSTWARDVLLKAARRKRR